MAFAPWVLFRGSPVGSLSKEEMQDSYCQLTPLYVDKVHSGDVYTGEMVVESAYLHAKFVKVAGRFSFQADASGQKGDGLKLDKKWPRWAGSL